MRCWFLSTLILVVCCLVGCGDSEPPPDEVTVTIEGERYVIGASDLEMEFLVRVTFPDGYFMTDSDWEDEASLTADLPRWVRNHTQKHDDLDRLAESLFLTDDSTDDHISVSKVEPGVWRVHLHPKDGVYGEWRIEWQLHVSAYHSSEAKFATDFNPRPRLHGGILTEAAAGDVPQEPTMESLPAATFTMGADASYPDQAPAHAVALDAFAISQTEITNGAFVKALNWAQEVDGFPTVRSNPRTAFDDGSVYIPGGSVVTVLVVDAFQKVSFRDETFVTLPVDQATVPVAGITWRGALYYAAVLNHYFGYEQTIDLVNWTQDTSKNGYRLPTEAEWEYAARGGLAAARYPWGDGDLDATRLYMGGPLGAVQPVAQYPANGFGLYDMGGNVSEWCADWYGSSSYSSAASSNPLGPASGSERVVRGGSVTVNQINSHLATCAYRQHGPMGKDGALRTRGFRLVRSLTTPSAPADPVASVVISDQGLGDGDLPFYQVELDMSGSSDADGSIVSYTVDWGDGTPASTGSVATADHAYFAEGLYTITVTVTDDDGRTDSATTTVTVMFVVPTAIAHLR